MFSRGDAESLSENPYQSLALLCVPAPLRENLLFFEAIDGSSDPFFHQCRPKVQEVTQFQSGQPQIGLKLFHVNRGDAFYGFQFKNDLVFDDDIRPKSFIEMNILILYVNRFLAFYRQPSAFELFCQNDFMDGFEQPRPQLPMDGDGRLENDRANLVFCHFHSRLFSRGDAEALGEKVIT